MADSVIAASIQEPLRLRFFLIGFGAVALVIGMVGVYGVVSYTASTRRSEYGLRAVVGASPLQLLARVMWSGLTPVAVGIFGGVGVSILGSRVLRAYLYDVSANDPATFLGVALALLVVQRKSKDLARFLSLVLERGDSRYEAAVTRARAALLAALASLTDSHAELTRLLPPALEELAS